MNRGVRRVIALLLCAAVAALAACKPKAEIPTAALSPSPSATAKPTPEPTPLPSPTPEEPTPTPTPEASPTPSAEASATPLPAKPIFTVENFPRMDGSTANLPLMALTFARTTGIDEALAQTYVQASRTSMAYNYLINESTDFLLAYEPSGGTRQLIAESGVKLEYTPIGRDALVFIANADNPVDSLTTEQIRGIYEGKITNWSEVGGQDGSIIPFQRDPDSGSQSLFVSLVMGDRPLMQAPTSWVATEMSGLIEWIAAYDNDPRAIGYSVYYYASSMYSVPGLKFIAVDGVMPSNDSIADGSYPHVNDFYAVIRESESPHSAARRLRDWFLTDVGKQCVKDAGYVALP